MLHRSQLIKQVLLSALWIRLTWGFISEELIPPLADLSSYINLLFDAVIVILGLFTISDKRDLIIGAVTLGFTATVTLIFNGMDLLFYLNGMRDFIAYIFVLPILRYFMLNEQRWRDFSLSFDKALFIFLLVQVFCIVEQFIRYGSGDHVGGSLGNSHSGIISTLIYAASFYLMQKRVNPDNFLVSIADNIILILLLIPSFLNETKISFFFLAMYFIFLIPINRKIFIRLIFAVPAILLLLWGGATAYVVSTGGSMGDVFSIDYYIEGYLLAEDDENEKYAKWIIDNDSDEVTDIPRFTKFILLDEVFSENPGHRLTGYGVGHFKGGTIVADSDFFNDYKWLFSGTIPYAFHVIIQVGFIGLILTLAFFLWLILFPQLSGYKRNNNLQLYLFFSILLLYLYTDSLRNAYLAFIFAYFAIQAWNPFSQAHPTRQ